MKKEKVVFLLSILCMVLTFTLFPFTAVWAQTTPSPKQMIKPGELSLALMIPPTHTRWIISMEPWIKSLEARTGRKVKIVPYFAEALAKGAEIYTATSQGIADLGELSTGHSPGQFRLTDFFLLPGLEIADSIVASRLHWHMAKTVPEFGAQYADTRLIQAYGYGGSATVVMSRKPVRTLEDLRGKKFNIYGGPIGLGTAQALGFTPVHMNIPDVYMAVEKGVLDGVISAVGLIISRRFGEIMKHVTYGPSFGGPPFIFVMNRDKWNKLHPDVQKAFDELGGMSGSEFFGKGMLKEEEDARAEGKKKYGVEFYKLPPDELSKWVKRLDNVQEDWVKGMESRGLAARKVIEEYRRFVQSPK